MCFDGICTDSVWAKHGLQQFDLEQLSSQVMQGVLQLACLFFGEVGRLAVDDVAVDTLVKPLLALAKIVFGNIAE